MWPRIRAGLKDPQKPINPTSGKTEGNVLARVTIEYRTDPYWSVRPPQVHAAADSDGVPGGLNKNPSDLGLANEQIVRPLDIARNPGNFLDRRCKSDGCAQRDHCSICQGPVDLAGK